MVFKAFTPLHAVCLGVVVLVIAAWCVLGRAMLKASPQRELTLRRVLGVAFIVYQTWYLGRFFQPALFTWDRAIPIMVCDIAAWLSGVLLIWHRRWTRNLLYFWGLGLCTQALVSPAVIQNIATDTLRFWTFWIGHSIIVGTPIYDLIVHKYRPTWKDYRFVAISAAVYCGLAAGVNYWLDHSGLLAEGVHANYGYIGNTKPTAPTIIDKLGPWPERIVYVAMIVYGTFAVLTVVWPANRRRVARSA
jgi:hypothetical integral membrane protein (TIGR02206 family)